MSPYAYLPMLTYLVCLHTLTYQSSTSIYGSHLSPSDHAGVLSVGAIERWKNKQKVSFF